MIGSGIVAAICLLGIIFNILLVYVTAKNKTLHGRCNFLFAFNSLTAIPTLYGIFFPFFVQITGLNFIPLKICYLIQIPALIGGPLTSTSLLCIGIDRFISVLFPIWYKGSSKFQLLYILLAFCGLRAIYRNALYFYAVTLYPEKKVLCSPGDVNQGEIGKILYNEGLILFWAEFLCYLIIWAAILFRKKNFQNLETTKKLMISLTVIIGISLFGSIQAQVYRIILQFIPFNSANFDYLVQLMSSCLYALADSSNAPVLFLLSSEYRSAFLHSFGFLKKLNKIILPPNLKGNGNARPIGNAWCSS